MPNNTSGIESRITQLNRGICRHRCWSALHPNFPKPDTAFRLKGRKRAEHGLFTARVPRAPTRHERPKPTFRRLIGFCVAASPIPPFGMVCSIWGTQRARLQASRILPEVVEPITLLVLGKRNTSLEDQFGEGSVFAKSVATSTVFLR